MKFLTKYENIEAYSNEAFRLPYPNVSLVKGLPNKKSFYREEPAWVKCVYEIPSEAFESTSAVTVLNSTPGYINDYKINGVYGEVEPLRVEEDVEVEIFQPYTMEGMQVYLPTTDACFLIPNLSTETEFTLSRPLSENDIIIMVIYSDNELVDLQIGGTVGDFGENINSMFSFRSDTTYTYSDYFLETIKEQGSMYEGMKLGCFFVNGEWNENPLEVPSLNTTMIGNVLHGGVQKVEVLLSMLDENNKVVIEYSLLEHDNSINSTFRNVDYLKEIDFSRLNQKINSARSFKINSEAFIDCSVLENVKIGDYIISIGDNTFDGCISLPVYDNAYYADTYCVGVINNDVTSCIIKEGTKWINPTGFPDWDSKLESVVIPGSVISIPRYVFSYHYNLKTVEIENGVTSIDDGTFLLCSGLTSVVIPDSVTSIGKEAFSNCSGLTSVVIGSGCTSIGDEAFYGCRNLTSINIPDSVQNIGENAFSHCSSLYGELIIPDSVQSIGNYVFSYCTSLKSVKIGSGCTSIGDEAFYGCRNLTSVVIGSGCTSIGSKVFYNCSKLVSLITSSGNTTYDSRENCNCIIKTNTNTLVAGCNNSFIPDSVTSIGDNAFSTCSGLTGELVIPDSVQSIGEWAFGYCYGLTSVVIPDSVTSIGEGALANCSGLASVAIPDSVISIGEDTFRNCSKLTSVVIPDSITSIGVEAFSGCTGLKNIVIPDSVITIDDAAFSGCSGLTSVEFGKGLTSIGSEAFYGCSGLTSVVISDSVKIIYSYAFEDCVRLKSVVIPDSVTRLDGGIFEDCKNLTSVEIGSGCTWIGSSTFENCIRLAKITCHALTAPSLSTDVFKNIYSYGTLYVPAGSDYKVWMSTSDYHYLGNYGWKLQYIS